MNHSRAIVLVVGMVSVTACSGSDASDVGDTSPNSATVDVVETDPPATDPPATDPPATDPPATDPSTTESVEEPEGFPTPREIVELLASDEFNGRDNQSDGSAAARSELIEALEVLAEPGNADGTYVQEYDVGTNIIGIIPGSGDLAEEYVLVGAHYDHLAPGECDPLDEPDDVICNGAADNAAGVASVMTIAYEYATSEADPAGDRSMIVALWDGEEDGLVGAEAYVANPPVPLDKTVAYVNFDIQGISLLPALSNHTVLVGPETGGDALVAAAATATAGSPLDYATFSLIFGQGRSDHAVLAANGVPSVFFTDANNGCYHTVLDDVDHVDFDKLDAQIATARALTFDLLSTTTPPTFVGDAPLSTYDDAVQLLALVKAGGEDLALLPDGGVAATEFIVALDEIVGAGADAYDDAAGGVVLGGAAQLVGDLAASECRIP